MLKYKGILEDQICGVDETKRKVKFEDREKRMLSANLA